MNFKLYRFSLLEKALDVDTSLKVDFEISLKFVFDEGSGVINIVFIEEKVIHDLNLEYRGVDASTDVLSFNMSDSGESDSGEVNSENTISDDGSVAGTDSSDTNSRNIIGEVYVSLEYLRKNSRLNLKETVRIIVHGVLHILGYEHEGYFEEYLKAKKVNFVGNLEEMYVIQEEKLDKILKKIK